MEKHCMHAWTFWSQHCSLEQAKIVLWIITLSGSLASLLHLTGGQDAIKNNELSFTSLCFAASQQILPLLHRVLTVPRQRFNSFFFPPSTFTVWQKVPVVASNPLMARVQAVIQIPHGWCCAWVCKTLVCWVTNRAENQVFPVTVSSQWSDPKVESQIFYGFFKNTSLKKKKLFSIWDELVMLWFEILDRDLSRLSNSHTLRDSWLSTVVCIKST